LAVQNLITDEELVQRAQAGDLAAFNILYDRYLTVVFRRVRYSVPEADVEDVTQEVFIAVIRSLNEFRGNSKFRTWLYTILGRKIADYYRHRDPADFQWKTEDTAEPVGMDNKAPYGMGSSTLDDAIYVRQGLRLLPQHYREVILLRFVDDLPFLEIANQTGQSLEATKSLFRRAIAALQQILENIPVK
jgi:RNA polymerase sigma-70 factor (ECF subfamily)